MKRFLILLLIAALVCCASAMAAEKNVLQFDKNVSTVFEGETLQTVLNRGGAPAGGTLTYSSASKGIATVDENGVVTGVAKGTANIVATVVADGRTYRAQLSVTVAKKAESVTVDTAKLPLFTADDPVIGPLLQEGGEDLPVLVVPVKKAYELQCTVLPKNATNRKTVLSTGDAGVLKVKGLTITGVAPGETVLTVANQLSPEVNTQFRVLVVKPVTRIEVTAPAAELAVGGQLTLSASVIPADAAVKGVTWRSGDETIATIDQDGMVTGLKRGSARLIATSTDGSNIRANISLKVVQKAESITLNKDELTIDVGRTGMLTATVLPKDTNSKNVTWSTSDASVATVNKEGRVTGVSLGTCEITCSSAGDASVKAVATVNVQQPVTKVAFDGEISVYAGETGKVTWTVQPANASNPALSLSSTNTKILTVSDDGTVTGVKQGEAYVKATTTDGSNRQAKVKVKVLQHVEGVEMRRRTAYIDVKETASTEAILSPKNASNKNMTWRSAKPSIATVSGTTNKVKITGVAKGETTVYGITEDGGFETSIRVLIGDWDHALKLNKVESNAYGDVYFSIKNVSDLNITRITLEGSFYRNGEPVPVNSKNGSNTVTITYKKTLRPGESTVSYSNPDKFYKCISVSNYQKDPEGFNELRLRIVSYQIDGDWVKTIRNNHRPSKTWKW